MSLIFVIFIAITCIQLCYYLFIFSSFSFAKKTKNQRKKLPVSILICARNEAANIKEFLPSILDQEYPNFELILIDDASTDNTLNIFKSIQKKHLKTHQIKILSIRSEDYKGKKHALAKGIKAASNEHLLFIDADCKPISKYWISEMVSNFTSKKEIILGYGAHQKIKNSLLNKLIRFETLYTALQYFSYSKIGLTYMGVGRNLAYKKSLFLNNKGFEKHENIKSGDDDLFINQNATRRNVSIEFNPNSFTVSEPKTTFHSWIQQKRRHVSTANSYKLIHKILLGISYSSQFLFWGLASLLLFLNYKWELVLLIIGIRILIQYLIIGKSAIKLKEKDLIIWIPILEIFLIFAQLFIFIQNKISKPTHW